MDVQIWLWAVLGGLALLVLLLFAVVMKLLRDQRSLASGQRWYQGQLDTLQTDQRAIESALVGLGEHIQAVEKAQGGLRAGQERFGARLDELAARLSDNDGAYAHAIRLASQGRVSVRELVENYGIPEVEAALLVRMHREGGGSLDSDARERLLDG
ncbi:MAG: DUF2802 domain-containing protein [Halothiobacillaceae bacterium]